MAVEAGVDAVGFIFAERSPKRVDLEQARVLLRAVPTYVVPVAVFVRPTSELVAATRALGFVTQFSGDEAPDECEQLAGERYIKALHCEVGQSYTSGELAQMAAAYFQADVMFDSRIGETFGGTGRVSPWELIAPIAAARRTIVSGGLTAENVAECIRAVRPFGVDVRSGVETDGQKDPQKVRAFVRAVREIDAKT
jgi:phosphoribosylanthranilate isomerase